MPIVGHFSDLHGRLDPLALNTTVPDFWIWTGDILREDWSRPVKTQLAVQHSWILGKAASLAKWFHGKPVLVVNGNHDWIDPVRFLQANGVDARAVTLQKQEVCGFTYAGFPNIPVVDNPGRDRDNKPIPWRYQTHEGDMAGVVDKLFEDSPELLITHAPPGQILDRSASGNNYGIDVLTRRLSFVPHNIRYHFFGHVHSSAGLTHVDSLGVTFSNAACRLQFVDVTRGQTA